MARRARAHRGRGGDAAEETNQLVSYTVDLIQTDRTTRLPAARTVSASSARTSTTRRARRATRGQEAEAEDVGLRQPGRQRQPPRGSVELGRLAARGLAAVARGSGGGARHADEVGQRVLEGRQERRLEGAPSLREGARRDGEDAARHAPHRGDAADGGEVEARGAASRGAEPSRVPRQAPRRAQGRDGEVPQRHQQAVVTDGNLAQARRLPA